MQACKTNHNTPFIGIYVLLFSSLSLTLPSIRKTTHHIIFLYGFTFAAISKTKQGITFHYADVVELN